MSDEKTYIFPDGAGNTNGMDPAALMAMMNNGGFGNGSWIWVIFLFFLAHYSYIYHAINFTALEAKL